MNIFQRKIISGNALGLGNPLANKFGYSTSLNNSGNILAIGAPNANTNFILDCGAVYIITGSGSTWNQTARLTGNTLGLGNPSGDLFGWSTSLNSVGNILAIGAPNADTNIRTGGAVYIFTGQTTGWNQTARLTGNTLGLGNPSGDSFGWSTSLNSVGNILAIGAPNADTNNISGGAVYIFTGSGSSWAQTARLTGNILGLGNQNGNQFGYSLVLNSGGNILAVGDPKANTNSISEAGAVYIFTGSENSWSQTIRITGNPSGIGDVESGYFGYSVSLNSSGNILAIGAIYATTFTGAILSNEKIELGAVYTFTGQGNNWIQTSRITGNPFILNSGASLDRPNFGTSVVLNKEGNTLAVGAPNQGFNEIISAGTFFIFSGSGNNWIQTAARSGFHGGDVYNDRFGQSISLDEKGNIFAVGGYFAEINNINPAGLVWIFSEKNNQSINFPPISTKTFGDSSFILNQKSSADLEINYISSNNQVARILGNLVDIVGAGSTTITASQSGNQDYYPATNVNQILTVNKANQIITFNSLPTKTFTDAPFILSGISSAGLTIFYTSSNTSVATINQNIVTIVGAGTSVITANQVGDSNYNPATSVSQTFVVNKADQQINFSQIQTKYFGDEPFNPNAFSTSNLPISYISSDDSIASIRNSFVYINDTGTCSITGSQTGNINYNAAPNVASTLNIKIFKLETEPSSISPSSLILNTNNYNIAITGTHEFSKNFNLLDDEKIEVGFDKNKNYNLLLKNTEKDFAIYKTNNNYIQGANSFINFSNLVLDLTDNLPQRTVDNKSRETDIAYITYRLNNTNNNKLKAFNIDFENIITGLVVNQTETPRFSYLPYTGQNRPCYPYTEFTYTDTCTDVFLCAICSEGRRIYLERGFGSYMDVPRNLLPFNTYSQILDYDSSFKRPGSYRILLNSKFFGACCCGGPEGATELCGVDSQTALESFESYCDINNYVELKTFQRIKSNDIIISGARKSIIEYLEENYNILFLDRIYFPELDQKYRSSYFSGQINNIKGFTEGDEIEIKQYYYPFRESFYYIFSENSKYGEVDKKFTYSVYNTGENYFSNQTELIQKINLAYNSSGIYSWIPLAYPNSPNYDFGPMLLAEPLGDNDISIKSLKSGWLGRYPIKLNFSDRRKGIALTYMLPKIIKLQGSNDLSSWEDIVSSEFTPSINEIIKNINTQNVNLEPPYADERVATPTKVSTTITVPIGTTLKNTV